ncbi:TPA: hypothetical protein JZ897_003665 [Escherichia coli]|uniref:hypothetical protein n=1 Tax=Escherichia coli TaxID=562 RepID=UPI000D6DD2BC|nr:hypothetical protein [Escherichia coli]HAO1323938.1 hypothetical protein [Escherichia coli]HBJ6076986.1 hypothetical protein [Escherichia coli]HCQ0034023.1 hypothetical protein [Escherichia coli]
MTTNNHPAHGPVSLDRLHQIREILSKAAAQSDGGNLGYAMADAVKVIDGAIAAFGDEPVGYFYAEKPGDWYQISDGDKVPAHRRIPLYSNPQSSPVVKLPNEFISSEGIVVQIEKLMAVLAVHGIQYERRGNAFRAATLHDEPVSNSDELPLDYLQGHKDGLEWAAQLAEANHPQTGDWLYDDPIELARAIRKGPDMPTVQGGNSPVIPDDVRRMDWLVSKTVDVREPMVYGSHSLFWSQTITDEEDDYHATKLREQIDAAMAAEQAAAPQQEAE